MEQLRRASCARPSASNACPSSRRASSARPHAAQGAPELQQKALASRHSRVRGSRAVPPPALAGLAAFRQFLCLRPRPESDAPGKMDKLPVSPLTGQVVSAHDPAHWVDAQTACNVATHVGAVIRRRVLAAKAATACFSLTSTRTRARGLVAARATDCGMFPGAAVELSQSRKGLHIIGRGTAPDHGCKRDELGMEFYTEGRFIALTGRRPWATSTPTTRRPCTSSRACVPARRRQARRRVCPHDEPVPEWRGPVDDDELLRRALNSRSAAAAFGVRASFADLWKRTLTSCASPTPRPTSSMTAGAADAALAAHLAFWTGKHGERIERLMRQSALKRDKWDRSGDDYLARTICEVIARGGDVLQDKPPEPPQTPMPAADSAQRNATSRVKRSSAWRRNATCSRAASTCGPASRVRARRPHAQARTVPRRLRRLRVRHGRRQPTHDAQRVGGVHGVADSARADGRHDLLSAAGPAREHHGGRGPHARQYIGPPRCAAWWATCRRSWTSCASSCPTSATALSPGVHGRMRAVHQGRKFQWWPVIQGVEGNGKRRCRCASRRPSAQHYAHWPKAKDLLSKFNGWLANKVFVGVEELQSADSHEQNDVIESLKTTITGATRYTSPVEGRRPSLNGNRRQRHGDDELQNGRA
jgi:hypothetical protein